MNISRKNCFVVPHCPRQEQRRERKRRGQFQIESKVKLSLFSSKFALNVDESFVGGIASVPSQFGGGDALLHAHFMDRSFVESIIDEGSGDRLLIHAGSLEVYVR